MQPLYSQKYEEYEITKKKVEKKHNQTTSYKPKIEKKESSSEEQFGKTFLNVLSHHIKTKPVWTKLQHFITEFYNSVQLTHFKEGKIYLYTTTTLLF